MRRLLGFHPTIFTLGKTSPLVLLSLKQMVLHIAIWGLSWLVPQQATAALAVRSLSYSRFICSPNTFST